MILSTLVASGIAAITAKLFLKKKKSKSKEKVSSDEPLNKKQ